MFSEEWGDNFFSLKEHTTMLNTRFYELWTVLFLMTQTSSQLFAQAQSWRDFEQASRKAYQNKDVSAFVSNLEQALALKPNHTRLMYNLAIGYCSQARYDDALGHLQKIAATGLVFNAAKNPAFAILKDSTPYKTRFEAVCKRFEESLRPVGTSTTAFELSEKALLIESIAYDPLEKAFYVGSIHKRKIVKIAADGTVKDFSQPSDNLWSVSGMKVDAKRRKIWVCSNAFPQMQGYDSTLKGRAALSVYDLKTGRIEHRYYAPNDGTDHAFGDLTFHPTTGQAFISDSFVPVVYTVDAAKGIVKEWLKTEAGVWSSLQGLDFSPNGKTLFLADYSNGIFRIDTQTKKIQALSTPDSCIVTGTDGLYFLNGNLLGIQNGTNPQRIVRFRLNKAQSVIQGVDVLEANNPLFQEPTLGVLVGKDFYYIANSQWESVSEKGIAAPEKDWKPHTILKLRP
jgi:sugar lactone lactonase YvrE